MDRVTKRDLNQQTAYILDQVTRDGDVVITERGLPRWRLAPFQGEESALVRLEREGRFTRAAATPTPWPSPPRGAAYTDAEVDKLLDDMRGDH